VSLTTHLLWVVTPINGALGVARANTAVGVSPETFLPLQVAFEGAPRHMLLTASSLELVFAANTPEEQGAGMWWVPLDPGVSAADWWVGDGVRGGRLPAHASPAPLAAGLHL
jgi:hypothetical protein